MIWTRQARSSIPESRTLPPPEYPVGGEPYAGPSPELVAMMTERLVGLPLADVEQLAERSGWTVRVIEDDSVPGSGTVFVNGDKEFNRVDVRVSDGVVAEIVLS